MNNLPFTVYSGGRLIAAFAESDEALIHGREMADEEMMKPIHLRVDMINVYDSGKLIEQHDCQGDDVVDNAVASLDNPKKSPLTIYRVMSPFETMTIRDALYDRAQQAEQSSSGALRSYVDALPDDDRASIDANDLRTLLTTPYKDAKRLRALGDFLIRNHTVTHCIVTIPELTNASN